MEKNNTENYFCTSNHVHWTLDWHQMDKEKSETSNENAFVLYFHIGNELWRRVVNFRSYMLQCEPIAFFPFGKIGSKNKCNQNSMTFFWLWTATDAHALNIKCWRKIFESNHKIHNYRRTTQAHPVSNVKTINQLNKLSKLSMSMLLNFNLSSTVPSSVSGKSITKKLPQ